MCGSLQNAYRGAFFSLADRLFNCGLNRVARSLGRTGIVALVWGWKGEDSSFLTELPGQARKLWRLGEYRDTEPHDGDFGIPFPHVQIGEPSAVLPLLEASQNGHNVTVMFTRTRANPFLASWCGWWVETRVVLAIAYIMTSERAACYLAGHVAADGIRIHSLAQLSLFAEVLASLLWVPIIVEPYAVPICGLTVHMTWVADIIKNQWM